MMMDNNDKDLAGVGATMTAFAKIGWALRERGRIDYGIDADVEVKSDEKYQNKHIALQIKSGDSYLKVKKNGKISFSVDEWHYKYWLKSDRPVLILFYDIDNNIIIWEQVCLSNLKLGKTNHIIEINPSRQLTEDSKVELESIISNYQPFESFKIDPDCVNFDYSIHCYREIKTVLDSINNNFAYFRKKVNEQFGSTAPNTEILIKLFNDFTARLTSDQNLLYENYCKSHWYIEELPEKLNSSEKKELDEIINSNKNIIHGHIRIWSENASAYANLNHPNIPPKLQRAANNLVFRINEYIGMFNIIIETQSSYRIN